MKKKIFILLLYVISTVIFAFVQIFQMRILIILFLFTISLSVIGQKKFVAYINVKVPNIMKNHMRNYDTIILGDSRFITPGLLNDKGNVLLLDNYCRNFYTDILVMQRWYSMLKKGGKVYFIINNRTNGSLKRRISLLDNSYLHKVTLMEHGIKQFTIMYHVTKYLIGLYYLYAILNYNLTRIKRIEYECLEALDNDCKEVQMFCSERNMEVIFLTVKNRT